MSSILFILTSHDRMANGEATGVWLEEYAVPYNRRREPGAEHSGAGDRQSHVVRDGRLINGQNPRSSAAVADELIAALG